MATFTGFAPAENPALSAIVVLDRPTPIFGGEVAAPVFSQVMAYALQRYGIPSSPGAPGGARVSGLSVSTIPLGVAGTQEGDAGGGSGSNAGSAQSRKASDPTTPGTIARSAANNARGP
jgi:hypothetical protein